MASFSPRQRTEIYASISAQVLANAPLTSSELGEVVDNLNFSVSDSLYELYGEMQNALSLLKLDTTTGADLDNVASEFPDLKPRFQASRATGVVTVSDPNVTKVATIIGIGGANSGDNFLNVVDASLFPSAGQVLIGTRGSSEFETFTYNSKSGNQLQSTGDTIDFDHGSGEAVVLTTVGDRVFSGPFSLATQATPTDPVKNYTSTSTLIIYDGEESGDMSVRADVEGPSGNTPSNTISRFIGTPPFVTAQVSNGAPITNGQAREKDADLRARIRQQRQALSTGNIDAVTAKLFDADYQGQKVKFVQVVEDPLPNLPSIAYVDDGSGFTPGQTLYTQDIMLVFSALGGEKRFFVPSDYLPIVTSDAENALYTFSNVILRKNGVILTQGSGANQYFIHPNRGVIKLNTALAPGDELKITSILFFNGLLQQANHQLYGKREDRENYPGVVSLGTWIQPRVPSSQFVTIQGNIVYDGSRSVTDVVNEIKQNMLSYINNLGIGNTVVRNRLISLAFVSGVKDFTLLLPVADIIIPDGTLARTTTGNISVS